jgi:outer membrane protein assembly factor BamB
MHWRVVLLTLLLFAQTVRAGDWPQWLGPNRDGASAESVQPWKAKPATLWSVPAGEGFSVPVVAGGRVFVHARVADKQEEEVVALDARTGKQVWRAAYPRTRFSSFINSGPQGSPCVVGGRVYTYGITGILSCFDADSGKQVWQVDAIKKVNARVPRFGTTCSPLVVGKCVLVAVGGKGSSVMAFDADTGAELWKALNGPVSTGSPVVYFNRTRKDAAGLEAIFIDGRSLVALNPFDGEVSWQQPLADQTVGTAPSPVVAGDLLLASTMRAGGIAVQLTRQDDKMVPAGAWKNADLTGYFCTPVVCGKDYIYTVTSVLLPQPASTLRCIDVRSGKVLWNQPGIGIYSAGMVRLQNNRLLLLNDKGVLYLIEHDPKAYKELAKAQVCGATFVTPALADGCLYVRDNKVVSCIKLGE